MVVLVMVMVLEMMTHYTRLKTFGARQLSCQSIIHVDSYWHVFDKYSNVVIPMSDILVLASMVDTVECQTNWRHPHHRQCQAHSRYHS